MRTENIKIIFQDIDGCLNPDSGEAFGATLEWEPSPSQIDTLRLISQAIDNSSLEHFVLNTGRPWSLVHEIAKHLPTPKFRYALLEHACVLYDRQDDCYLDCAKIASQLGMNELASRYQNLSGIKSLIDWFHKEGQAILQEHYQAQMPIVEKVGNLSFAIPKAIDGNDLLQHVESIARQHLSPEILAPMQFLRSDSYIDILPGIDKLDGLQLLSSYLELPQSHALAVGDYLNDQQIFEHFERVLCPENAHPTIKELTLQKGPFGEVSSLAYGSALIDLLQRI